MGSLEEEAGFGFGGCLGLEVVCDMVVGEEMGFGVREEIQLGREEEEGKGRGGVWGMEPEVGASVCSSCSSSWGIDIISGSGSSKEENKTEKVELLYHHHHMPLM